MIDTALLRKVLFGFQVCAFAFVMIGFISPFWNSMSNRHIGLWYFCTDDGCEGYNGKGSNFPEVFPSKLTQACACIGLIFSIPAFVFYVTMFVKRNTVHKLTNAGIVFSLIAGLFAFSAGYVFDSSLLQCNISCFFMQVAGVIYITVALVTLFVLCFGPRESSSRHATESTSNHVYQESGHPHPNHHVMDSVADVRTSNIPKEMKDPAGHHFVKPHDVNNEGAVTSTTDDSSDITSVPSVTEAYEARSFQDVDYEVVDRAPSRDTYENRSFRYGDNDVNDQDAPSDVYENRSFRDVDAADVAPSSTPDTVPWFLRHGGAAGNSGDVRQDDEYDV